MQALVKLLQIVFLSQRFVLWWIKNLKFTVKSSNLFFQQTDHVSLICFDCKEQIVNFYNFKQKVKPNLNTVHADDKILDHVRDFLNENTEQMIVIQDNQDNSLKILGAARFEQETRYSHETEEVKVEDMTAEFTNEGKEVTDDSYQPETSSNIKHLPKINQTLTRFNHSNLQTLKRKHDGRAISSFSQIRKS